MRFPLISFCYIILIIRLTCSLDLSTTPTSMQISESITLSDYELVHGTGERSQHFEAKKRSSKTAKNDDDSEEDYEVEVYEDNVDEESDNEVVKERKRGRQRKRPIVKRVGITYTWARWEKWSRCSNTCVQIRKRQCVKRTQNTTHGAGEEETFYPHVSAETTGCQGILKKYRMCKDERCTKPSIDEMRNEQCASFNTIIIRGRFHQWLGYEKEHNECVLFCQAKDSDLVMDMNKMVMDGTPCQRPSIYYTHYYRGRAVCVEGICRLFITTIEACGTCFENGNWWESDQSKTVVAVCTGFSTGAHEQYARTLSYRTMPFEE